MMGPTPHDAAALDLIMKLAADGMLIIAFDDMQIQCAAWGRDDATRVIAEGFLESLWAAIASGCVKPATTRERAELRKAMKSGKQKKQNVQAVSLPGFDSEANQEG